MRTVKDHSALIKKAAALPVGSTERREILAVLKAGMKLRGGPAPNEMVELTISQARGPDIFKGKIVAGGLQGYNDLLDAFYEAKGGDNPGGYDDKFSRYEDAKRTLKDAAATVKELEGELQSLFTTAKHLKVDLDKLSKADLHYTSMDVVDSSGQKWMLDGGEEWMLDE